MWFFHSLIFWEFVFQHKIELEFWPLSTRKVMIDWKRRLESYWRNSISNNWHWKRFIEKLQFFSFLLIIILLHFRKVPILLTQLDCHTHSSVSLLDFFLYLIRFCQCCTSAARCNKKYLFCWLELPLLLHSGSRSAALCFCRTLGFGNHQVCSLRVFLDTPNLQKCANILDRTIIFGKFQPDNWLYFFHQGFN